MTDLGQSNPFEILDMPDMPEILAGADPAQLATELYDDPIAQMVIDTGPQELNELERSSAIWLKIKGLMSEKLENYRIENDKPLNEVDTARLRGKIQERRDFLALGESSTLEYEEEAPGGDIGY